MESPYVSLHHIFVFNKVLLDWEPESCYCMGKIISDGMLMSFQGNTLHHGTIIQWVLLQENYVLQVTYMASILALSMQTLTSLCCIQIDQYLR